MKLDIKKKLQIQSLLRLTFRDAVRKSYQVTRESLENFESSLIRIKQGEKRKRCHPRSDFRLWVDYISYGATSTRAELRYNHQTLHCFIYHRVPKQISVFASLFVTTELLNEGNTILKTKNTHLFGLTISFSK